MATANEQILDLLVRHQIGLRRLSAQQARDLIAILNKHDARIVRALSAITGNTTARQVESILRVVYAMNLRAYEDVETAFIRSMEELANYEVGFQGNSLAEVMTAEILLLLGLTGLSRSEIITLVVNTPIDGAKIKEYVAGAAAGRYNRMRDAVRREHGIGGTGVQDGIKRAIVGSSTANYKDGVLGSGRRSIEMINRTVQHGIVHATRDMLYNRNDHLFEGVLWVSVLDSRTSAICWSRSGKIYPVNSGPRPPAHPNCRSIVIPIITDWRSLGLNDLPSDLQEQLSGNVPKMETYAQWLARQSARIQDEVLGPTRGRLYRNKGITLDRFTDDTGRRYTLKELARREGIEI